MGDRYKEHNLISFMAFISRFINKRIASLINRFSTPQLVKNLEKDYPLQGMGDHHRFLL